MLHIIFLRSDKMTNKYTLFSIIENLKLEENTIFQFCDWFITNDRQIINKTIPHIEALVFLAGSISYNTLCNKTIAFKIYESKNEISPNNILHQQSANLNGFLLLIWLITDNSVFSSIQVSQNINTFDIATNHRDTFISNSKGLYEPLLLDKRLISEIDGYNLLEKYHTLSFLSDDNSDEISQNGLYKSDIENRFVRYNRIQRSFLLLNIARATSFLPMKIGFYINTLECLLLKSDTELNFRLQLYSANFIGENENNKQEIMNTIKAGYNVRSKFFHGEGLSADKIKDLQELSQKIDDIVRKTIIKAASISEKINDNKKMEEFFKSILFS